MSSVAIDAIPRDGQKGKRNHDVVEEKASGLFAERWLGGGWEERKQINAFRPNEMASVQSAIGPIPDHRHENGQDGC